MTVDASEIRFCPTCFGRLYLVYSTPLRWAHVATDTTACSSEAKVVTAEQLAEVILDTLGNEASASHGSYISFDEGHLDDVRLDGTFDLVAVAAAALKALS